LTITDLYISPKSKPDTQLKSIDDLYQLSKNQNQNLIQKYQSSDENASIISKFLTLQSEEEANILFKIDNPILYYNQDKYTLYIKWLNLFDAKEKQHIYEFNNGLNTFNNYYKITVAEKPENNIVINHNFKITLKLESKNLNKKYFVSLSQEALRDNDKTYDREIEIIDIIEKKIELSQKNPSNNFILICKSDFLGNVYLPRLKFLLFEENNSIPIGHVYDALLCLNCVEKEE
jgi:hypothetical protein